MSEDLKQFFKGKVVLFGIGNILRGDDALGPMLVEMLRGRVNASCINAEGTPENYLGKIIKENPDTILIIDAVHLNLKPGEYRILDQKDLEKSGFSTHDISLGMLIDYMKSQINTDIFILGVEPRQLQLGAEVSETVKKTLEHLKKLIIEAAGAAEE